MKKILVWCIVLIIIIILFFSPGIADATKDYKKNDDPFGGVVTVLAADEEPESEDIPEVRWADKWMWCSGNITPCEEMVGPPNEVGTEFPFDPNAGGMVKFDQPTTGKIKIRAFFESGSSGGRMNVFVWDRLTRICKTDIRVSHDPNFLNKWIIHELPDCDDFDYLKIEIGFDSVRSGNVLIDAVGSQPIGYEINLPLVKK